MEVRIHSLADLNEETYSSYLAKHPKSMLFHSFPYLAIVASLTDAEQHIFIASDHSQKICGVLPTLTKNGPLGKVLNSLPFYGSNGGVLSDCPEAEKALVDAYNEHVLADETASATIITNPLLSDVSPDFRHTLTDHRIGQFTSLDYTRDHAESLMQSFHSKTRNMVRKGEKSGVETNVENERMDFLFRVHLENMKAVNGTPKPEKFFNQVQERFTAGKDYKIYVARLGGEPVAAVLLFFFGNTVEYFTPVVRAEHRDKQPLSLLIHRAMTDASKQGYKLWNWGGTWSSQATLYHFKKRWGTYDVEYNYLTHVGNKDLLTHDKEKILASYPYFFVVPFHAIETDQN